MSERRFVIREWGEGDPNPGWTVTESQLKRRLAYVARNWEKQSVERSVECLVYGIRGEGEKSNPPQAG